MLTFCQRHLHVSMRNESSRAVRLTSFARLPNICSLIPALLRDDVVVRMRSRGVLLFSEQKD